MLCGVQRVLCALCGTDLSPPDYAHECTNVTIADTVIELKDQGCGIANPIVRRPS